jgi:serine/threonine protein kinase
MDSDTPGLPDTIGRHYRVVARVGTGGMGVVYKAIDTRLNRAVAIKAIHDRRLLDARDRLRAEALAAAALDHPYICKVYELIEDGTDTYLVMEYVDGQTLASILRTGLPPVSEVVQLGCEIVEGLAAAHARGLVHRDIKPSNVMVTGHGHVKLLDFGLARSDVSSTPGDETHTSPAATGSHAGTPHYMAPEQAVGEPVTARADLFSTGVLLFECLTGKLPFVGSSPYDYVRHLLSDDPRPLDRLAPSAPIDLVRLVERCLQKTPADRPASAGELLIELRRISGALTATGIALQTAGHARQTRRWQFAAVSSVVVMAALVIWWWTASRPPPEPLRQSRPFAAWASESTGSRVSPDGRWVSFLSVRAGVLQLLVQSIDSSDARPVSLGPGTPRSHVWSPDGRELAVTIDRAGSQYLIVVPAFFGGDPRVTVEIVRANTPRTLRWIGDGVFLVAVEPGTATRVLHRVNLVNRSMEALSRGWKLPGELRSLDVHPDGHRVVLGIADANRREDLWETDLTGSTLRRLTDDEFFDRSPVWIGAGDTVLYQSNRGGPVDLWELIPESGHTRPLTSSATGETPGGASADGAVISFHEESEDAKLWTWFPGTRQSLPLTRDASTDFSPSVSGDGKRVLFQRNTPTPAQGFLIIDSKLLSGVIGSGQWVSEPRPVADGFAGMLSPDGALVAYLQFSGPPGLTTLRIKEIATERVVTVSTTNRLTILSPFPVEWGERNVTWTAGSDAVYFVEQADVQTIRRYRRGADAPDEPLVKGEPGQMLRDLYLSHDGRRLAYLAAGREGFVLRTVDVSTGAEREWMRAVATPQATPFLRGWLPNDAGIFLTRRTQFYDDRTWDIDLLVVPPDGPPRTAQLKHISVLTLRIDAAGRIAYATRAEQGVHNLYSIVLATGEMTRLTDNTLEGVTFGAVAIAGDQLIGVRHEQRRALWVIETKPSSR